MLMFLYSMHGNHCYSPFMMCPLRKCIVLNGIRKNSAWGVSDVRALFLLHASSFERIVRAQALQSHPKVSPDRSYVPPQCQDFSLLPHVVVLSPRGPDGCSGQDCGQGSWLIRQHSCFRALAYQVLDLGAGWAVKGFWRRSLLVQIHAISSFVVSVGVEWANYWQQRKTK